MNILKRLQYFSKMVKNNIVLYSSLLKDTRTPLIAKLLLWLAVGYLLLPFDIIPDFIPILGQIDDLIIVPLLIYSSLKFIPPELLWEYKNLYKVTL